MISEGKAAVSVRNSYRRPSEMQKLHHISYNLIFLHPTTLLIHHRFEIEWRWSKSQSLKKTTHPKMHLLQRHNVLKTLSQRQFGIKSKISTSRISILPRISKKRPPHWVFLSQKLSNRDKSYRRTQIVRRRLRAFYQVDSKRHILSLSFFISAVKNESSVRHHNSPLSLSI